MFSRFPRPARPVSRRHARRLHGAVLLLLLAATGSGTAGAQGIVAAPLSSAPAMPTERYALLIGNAEYDGNAFRRLDGVPYDIEAVSEALKGHGYDVEMHRDLPSDRMETVISRFVKTKAQRKDSAVIFYYAGHGVTVPNLEGVEQGYLVPVDTPSPAADSVAFRASLLPIFEFSSYAQRIQSRHALFLFDACFAGTIFKDVGVERDDTPPPAVADLLTLTARSVITSGSAGQKVPDESLFRQHLVRALQGEAGTFGDGFLTGEELGGYVRAAVLNEGGGQQRPQFGKLMLAGLGQGDFVFSLQALEQPSVADKEYREWLGYNRENSPALRKPSPPEKALLLFMTQAYDNAVSYDEDPDVTGREKLAIWKTFLDAFPSDLPSTNEDDTMRGNAIGRYDVLRKAAK